MWMTFKTTVRTLLHTPSAIVWTLVFPIVLATVFNFMFEPLRSQATVEPANVAVVDDKAWRASAFSQVVDALADSEEPLVAVHAVASEDEARELLVEGAVEGAYLVDPTADAYSPDAGAHGLDPRIILAPAGAGTDAAHEADSAIIQSIATSYLQSKALVARLAASDPAALGDPATVERALGLNVPVREVSLTHAQPDAMLRFYYALLGMASIFAAQLAQNSVQALQPADNPTGARRAVSGTSRMRLLIPTIAGCWAVSTAFLSMAFGYICLTAHIDFSDRGIFCLLGIGAAGLLSCSLGALIGSLPARMGPDARSGLLTAATCLLSLFAGLYGEPTMELADAVARAFPAATWLNPVCLIRDVFYSVHYYDTLGPFLMRVAACCGIAIASLALSANFMRRIAHEHL